MDIRKFMKKAPEAAPGGDDKAAAKEPKSEAPSPAPAKGATPRPSPAAKRQKTATPGGSARRKTGSAAALTPADDIEVVLDASDDDAGWEDDGAIDLTRDDAAPAPAPAAKKRKAPGAATPKAAAPKAAAKSPVAAAAKPKSASKPRGAAKVPAAMLHIQGDPAALAAVAAVDAAAAGLPPDTELGMTLLSEAAYAGKPPDEPAHLGAREPPRGHPDCFTGKTFVISGVLDSLTRGQAEDLIRRHGGKVTAAVSSKTSFLVVGQHTGRTKYQNAKTHGTKMINEAGLFALVAAAPPPPAAAAAPGGAAAAAPPPAVGAAGFYGGAGGSRPAAAPAATAPAGGPAPDNRLWVEKWRPKTSAELVGNQSVVATLRHWLRQWDDVHLHGKEPSLPPGATGPRAKDRLSEMKRKAVLLSGSPGIGKTSAALIVSRELGLEPVEVNASDTRSKADASVLKGVSGKLANSIKELTTNAAVSFGARRRLVLIMDEVDGMSAGDRGGVADLIKTIARSKIPIIAIANDKYSQKLKSLRGHCLDLDFRKPTAPAIAKRMMEIAGAEGLAVNQATMEALVQSAGGGDIRLVLGQLQLWRLRARALTYDQVRSGGGGTAKDLEMSPFEAARRLLDADAAAGLSLADQIELVFQDADLVPLLVQENYVNHRPRISGDDAARLRILAKASDAFSLGDIANRSVRQYQNWALMPFAAAMGSVTPAAYCRGSRETFSPHENNFPRFTAWLGQNSSAGKQRRLLGELHTRMLSSGALECDRTALRLSYLPVLRATLTAPLLARGGDGVGDVLATMNAYCLAREDIDFISDVTKFKTQAAWGGDPFKGVEPKVKAALTRAFNGQHLKPKTGFGMEEGKKKRGGKGRAAAAPAEEGEELLGEAVNEEAAAEAGKKEEEEEEADPEVLRRRLMGMKHAGMEVTLKDGSKATRGGRGGRGRGGRGRGGGRAAAGAGAGAGAGRGRGRGKK